MTSNANTRFQRRVVTAIVIGHLACVPAMAFAQQTSAAPQTPAAPQGPVLQLSMEQAEAMALESNLGLKADRLGPDIAAENLAAARSVFVPALSSFFSRSGTTRASTNVFEGTATSVTNKAMSVSTTVSQLLPWYGGLVSVRWNAGRNASTEEFSRFNPTLNSGINLSFIQPLLEGFKIDSARASVRTAERNRQIADVQLEQSMVVTRVQVRTAYLNLIGAIESLKVAQQNLELSRESLRNNKSRVQVGTMAPIGIIQAEAEVASNEEGVILGEVSVSTAEDALRALIFDPARPDYWQVGIQPTDSIQLQATEVNVDAAIANALANRTDLIVARRLIENTDLNIELLRNQVKPGVDLQLNYAASGTGGTQNNYSNQFPPVLLTSSERGFGSVLGDAFRNTNPQWTVGVAVGYPIGKSSAEAALATRRLEKQRAEIELHDAELQVTTTVRDVARQVTTGAKRVQVTQIARESAQKQLDAEQKRFDLSLSTTFELQSRQRDLANAKTRELRAIIDYRRALIIFEAVQRAPVR
ncbi:MAG: TolC family protein [Vicinamibacterales bacterium]